MIEKYRKYLECKKKNDFWKKAKQKEYTTDALDKICKDLTINFGSLTTRNSITLRYLGFVINLGADKLKLSNAGKTFLDSLYKQKILDEQIMKVYLDCSKLNNNVSIKVAPMEILLYIFYDVKYITFDEYQLFICWINNKSEISQVIDMIKLYRNTENNKQYLETLHDKSEQLGIHDFADNVKRFFDMLLLSSYVRHHDNKIISNLSKKDIEIIIKSFSARDFSDEGYFNYLTNNSGWKIYATNSSYIKVIESLEQKTVAEQQEIINDIITEPKMPDISDVNPEVINLEISDNKEIRTKKKTKPRVPYKINFELRDNNNRAVGDFAEKIVLKYEKHQLTSVLPGKVSQVKQVSLIDDALGYDVSSFNIDGSEKHIEVKAVKNKPSVDFRFYISKNEIKIAREDKNYHLYIVFDYLSETPYIYKMLNPFKNKILGVNIDPIKYLVVAKIKNKQPSYEHTNKKTK